MTNTLISNDYNDQENELFQTGLKVGNGNVTFNFYYPHGTKETATIHLYGYDNPRMEKYPIANFVIPGFNLKNASPFKKGNESLDFSFKEPFSGNTWWFAWADVNEEQLIGKKIPVTIPESGCPPSGIISNCDGYIIEYPKKPLKLENYLRFSGYEANGCNKSLSDVAGMPFGQSGTTGIYLSSTGNYQLYISLQDNIEGFPQFAWRNINDEDNFDKYVVSCSAKSIYNFATNSYTRTGYGLFVMDLGRRNFFCAQDLLMYPTGNNQFILETNTTANYTTLSSGRGLPFYNSGNGFISSHNFQIIKVSNLDRNLPIRNTAVPNTLSINNLFFYEVRSVINVKYETQFEYSLYRTGESRPLYRPIKHPLA
jgi:hypothetical protein